MSPVARITAVARLSPSDAPAVDLPEYEPTPLDLVAVETADDEDLDDYLAQVVTLCAIEATRRDLHALRVVLAADQPDVFTPVDDDVCPDVVVDVPGSRAA